MKLIFWLSIILIAYTYFGYIMLLMFIYSYRIIFKNKVNKLEGDSKRNIKPSDDLPFVSFIVTAFNEEARISQKIKNSIELSYPRDRFEIIVASDCSSDQTDEIVQSYANQGIKLVRSPERKGKEHAQMHAIKAAMGTILVFSDVATILKPDAIELIVENFKNPIVGCVSSEDRFIDRDGRVSGEGLYVKYEMFIRKLESRVNTLVGLSGSFFAARREVCHNWAPDLQSDFNTLLNSAKMGLKGISAPKSIGYYENITDESKEFNRKMRTVLRGITVLLHNKHLLNPRHYGLFAWQLFSHKICRWLVPIFLIIAFVSNLFLIPFSFYYTLFFMLQVGLYSAALIHYAKLKYQRRQDKQKPEKALSIRFFIIRRIRSVLAQMARISYYFVSVNLSILIAWYKYFSGQRATYWEPSKRRI